MAESWMVYVNRSEHEVRESVNFLFLFFWSRYFSIVAMTNRIPVSSWYTVITFKRSFGLSKLIDMRQACTLSGETRNNNRAYIAPHCATEELRNSFIQTAVDWNTTTSSTVKTKWLGRPSWKTKWLLRLNWRPAAFPLRLRQTTDTSSVFLQVQTDTDQGGSKSNESGELRKPYAGEVISHVVQDCASYRNVFVKFIHISVAKLRWRGVRERKAKHDCKEGS